jgi:hypothetical protein
MTDDDDFYGCPECGEAWSSERAWARHRCGQDRGDATPPRSASGSWPYQTQQSSPTREER